MSVELSPKQREILVEWACSDSGPCDLKRSYPGQGSRIGRPGKPPLPCVFETRGRACGKPSTPLSSSKARSPCASRYTMRPLCAKHGGERVATLLPCHTCGKPSTRISSDCAKRRRGHAYCSRHRGGPQRLRHAA